MKRNPYKGLRKVVWEISVVYANKRETTLIKGLYKQEVKNYLRDFNASEEKINNGICLKIYRKTLIDSGSGWNVELMGYTDILAHGAVAYIDL
jgi:hypothetical protein